MLQGCKVHRFYLVRKVAMSKVGMNWPLWRVVAPARLQLLCSDFDSIVHRMAYIAQSVEWDGPSIRLSCCIRPKVQKLYFYAHWWLCNIDLNFACSIQSTQSNAMKLVGAVQSSARSNLRRLRLRYLTLGRSCSSTIKVVENIGKSARQSTAAHSRYLSRCLSLANGTYFPWRSNNLRIPLATGRG